MSKHFASSVLIIVSFLKDASNPSASKQKNRLQVVMLLLGFLCAIILRKHRAEWLLKNFPGKAVLKHPGRKIVSTHLTEL